MPTFGEKLRGERELREKSLAEVSAGTKISLRYLSALEGNDFDSLPGGVFNRGFVRAYAQFLGADADSLVRAYVEEERKRGAEETAVDLAKLRASLEAKQPKSDPRRTAIVGGVALAALLLAAGSWFWLARERPAQPRVAGAPAVAQAASLSPGDPDRLGPLELSPSDSSAEPARVDPPTTADDASETTIVPATETDEEPRREVVEDAANVSPPALPEPEPLVPQAEIPAVDPSATVEDEADSDQPRLSVNDFGVGTAVVNRQLQGRDDRFAEGTEVWFWTRVLGGEPGEQIRHVWFHEGQRVGIAPLTLGGAHWRTQSRRVLSLAGRWVVEVQDADERVLAREEFTCVPASLSEVSEARPATP